MRLYPTPLATPITLPALREGPAAAGLAAAIVPGGGQTEPATTLATPNLLLVTTGQQAGLFTGPLYTVFKALSAAALAAVLEARWRRPVRALFWVPGDDHDFDEISRVHWLDQTGVRQTARLPPRSPDTPLRPMWREPLGPAVTDLLDRLIAHLPATPHRPGIAEWLTRHYRPEVTVAAAFAGAMAELLAPFGVVCLDSTHEVVKRAAAPLLVRAARESAELERLLAAEARRFLDRGELPPVETGDGATLLFLDDRHGRDRLLREGNGFRTRRGGDRYTAADLETIAADSPTRLSANVLLRPIMESALLPTVGYVAGPGELRYLAMLPAVYQALGVPRQQPVPRWSGVIMEPHVERILGKFGATVEEVLHDFPGLERRVLRSHLPDDVPARLAEWVATADRLEQELASPLAGIDPTLAGPLASAHRQMVWAARDLERKALSRLRARETVELGQLERLRMALAPGGVPQERTLTLAPFLARHGPGLLAELHQAARAWYTAALEGGAVPP